MTPEVNVEVSKSQSNEAYNALSSNGVFSNVKFLYPNQTYQPMTHSAYAFSKYAKKSREPLIWIWIS